MITVMKEVSHQREVFHQTEDHQGTWTLKGNDPHIWVEEMEGPLVGIMTDSEMLLLMVIFLLIEVLQAGMSQDFKMILWTWTREEMVEVLVNSQMNMVSCLVEAGEGLALKIIKTLIIVSLAEVVL